MLRFYWFDKLTIFATGDSNYILSRFSGPALKVLEVGWGAAGGVVWLLQQTTLSLPAFETREYSSKTVKIKCTCLQSHPKTSPIAPQSPPFAHTKKP